MTSPNHVVSHDTGMTTSCSSVIHYSYTMLPHIMWAPTLWGRAHSCHQFLLYHASPYHGGSHVMGTNTLVLAICALPCFPISCGLPCYGEDNFFQSSFHDLFLTNTSWTRVSRCSFTMLPTLPFMICVWILLKNLFPRSCSPTRYGTQDLYHGCTKKDKVTRM